MLQNEQDEGAERATLGHRLRVAGTGQWIQGGSLQCLDSVEKYIQIEWCKNNATKQDMLNCYVIVRNQECK